jgi:hypothetical protein
MTRILWQFLPAFLIATGALLAALGGFWQSWRQSKFNAEIRQKNEQIISLQRDNTSAITGGDSFCEMALALAHTTGSDVSPVFVHHGKYPLYEVVARIVDIEQYHKLKAADDPSAINTLRGTTVPVGALAPGQVRGVPLVFQNQAGQNSTYNIFFFARNGAWIQQLRMRWLGGEWATATRVTDSEGKELYRKVGHDYPLGPDGGVEWEEKLEPTPRAQ